MITGNIIPSAVSTTGVMIFNAVVNISPGVYIPKIQQNAVKAKHQIPKVIAIP